MTISKHISAIRGLIKQFSDDSIYEDEFLFVLLNNANAMWLKRKLENNEKVNDWNWPSYCVELEAGLAHDCSCIPVGCKVLKTKYKIPKPLLARNRQLLKVYTLGGKEIYQTTEELVKASRYDDIKSNELAYSVYNQKIIIWNGNTETIVPRAIVVKSLSVDPTEWTTVESCMEDGQPSGEYCFDMQTSEYPMDEEYASLVYETVLKQLGFSLQIVENRTNNANPDV
jgi:hypothetical protein